MSANTNAKTHGHYMNNKPSLTYSSWDGMIGRCYRETSGSYHRYGAKGVSVVESWHKFDHFLEDMGERPSKDHSIDRIDNSKGYNP